MIEKEIRTQIFDPPKLESCFLNSEDTDVGVINKENAEGGINIRIES